MRALFEHFVVSNEAYDFDEAIDDKIDFINGLAMQNYRPEKDETPIPVIKIRELSQGYCDENSEFCSNHIDKSHLYKWGLGFFVVWEFTSFVLDIANSRSKSTLV